MPIFNYECQKCKHEYEQMTYRTDQVPTCPECKDDTKQEKKLSGFGFLRIENPDAPKNDAQLSRYLGNGKYF